MHMDHYHALQVYALIDHASDLVFSIRFKDLINFRFNLPTTTVILAKEVIDFVDLIF